jgi:hypothetical protein
MKVQYIKNYTDADGRTFLNGWTAEHADAEGQRRVDEGACKEVAKDARARRSTIVHTECIPDAMPEAPAEEKPKTTTFKRK